MSGASITLGRRQFLQATSTAAGGLLIGFSLAPSANAKVKDDARSIGFFVAIDPDGTTTIGGRNPEMGQGVMTSLPMLVAEEMDADWDNVKVKPMPLGIIQNPNGEGFAWKYGPQGVGGSTSVSGSWQDLREVGAKVRGLLIAAAAQTWNVSADSLKTAPGFVVKADGSDKVSYGKLAPIAAKMEWPEEAPALKDVADFRIIGKPTRQVHLKELVTGKLEYGIDAEIPGMKYAVIARCPYFDGKLASFDASKALAVPGVTQVVEVAGPEPGEPYSTMAAGVAVVADNTWAAMQGRKVLKVKWDKGPHTGETTSGFESNCDVAMKGEGQIVHDEGDFEAGFKSADQTFERQYCVPYVHHCTMEPQNCVAHVKEDSVKIIGPIQMPSGASRMANRLTGIDRLNIHVRATRLGGGFGRRLTVDYVAEAVLVSKAIGGPVKVQWTREDDMAHDFLRPGGTHQMKAGVDKEGNLVAWTQRLASASKYYRRPNMPDENLWQAELYPHDFPAHRVPNYRLEYFNMKSGAWRGSWRAPAHTANAFVIQSFIDEMAHELGRDPLEYRLALLGEEEALQYDQHGGPVFDTGRLAGVLKLAADKAGWGRKLESGRGRGIAGHFTFGGYVAYVADVTVKPSGEFKVDRVVGAVDVGIPVNPNGIRAQMEGGVNDGLSTAMHERISVKNGRIAQSNFDNYRLMRIDQSPPVEVHIVQSTEAPSGLGEPPVPPIAPAVTNAIFAATGKRIRKLPMGSVV